MVKFRAWDVAGNIEATKTQSIRIDIVAPTVSITSPANGVTVTGNIKIVASPADADSGIGSVRFYVDGVLLGYSDQFSMANDLEHEEVHKRTAPADRRRHRPRR